MNTHRRTLLAALLATPLVGLAQQRAPYIELKPAQPVEGQGKIDVIEFFWYGCIHCYNLEPLLEGWIKKQPADVHFRRVPAIFNDQWAHDANIFYTFEALGVLDKVHRAFFDAIHRDKLKTKDWKALSEWLQKNGVDAKKFEETFKSFGVQSRTKRAAQMTVGYKLEGTPAMAVDGRFLVNTDPGFAAMLATVDQLVQQSRKK
jgi:thiol:disulfide interchange protein DsbA